MAVNKGKNRLPLFLTAAVLLFIGGFWAYVNYIRGPEIDPSNARLRPKVGMENNATTTDSPAYYDANREHDRRRAEEARQSGESALAKPMGKTEVLPDIGKTEWRGMTPEQVMELIRQHGAEMEGRLNARLDALARQRRTTQDGKPSAISESMTAFLQRATAEYNNLQPGQLVMAKEAEVVATPLPAADSTTSSPVSTGGQTEKAPITAGEMLYAVLDVGANSDQPGTPVMARVVLGPWNGAKFIGGFTTGNEKLVLQFNRMIYRGKTYTVSGYAIDPQTLTPGVSSSVDTHFLERWGGLIAASFLEGFGRAVERSGTTYNYGSYGGNDTVAVPEYNLNEELWIAAGEVGKKASDIFANNFNRPPTVSLDPGTQVGILIL